MEQDLSRLAHEFIDALHHFEQGQEDVDRDEVSLLAFDDAGKIVRFRPYYDTRAFNRAVGAGAA